MKHVLILEDFMDELDLSQEEKMEIKDWVRKYEKYFNFHDTGNFLDSIDQITNDCLNQLGIDKSKKSQVQDYLQSLYTLSDGLSVIMAPGPEFEYTQIDQVQRFNY
jgi:hypothetical protein